MSAQKVLPIILLVYLLHIITIIHCLGFSSSMNKENIEVISALLIVRLLIFSVLKCNVCELEESLINRASFKKRSLKIAGPLVGALSVCK